MHLSQASQEILCCYTNSTTRIQIVKITNIRDTFFERTVMPQQSILFEAHQEAHLEIHTSEMMSAIVADVIPCWQLSRQLTASRKTFAETPVKTAAMETTPIESAPRQRVKTRNPLKKVSSVHQGRPLQINAAKLA